MKTKLVLILKGEPFYIGGATTLVRSEEHLFQLINDRKILLDCDQLRLIYNSFDPHVYMAQGKPFEVLKTLLAHGCPILAPNSKSMWFFTKKYIGVSYSVQTGHGVKIHLGKFYYTQDKDIDDQFPIFCQLVEYPPGFMDYFIKIVLKDGGKVLAFGPTNTATTLAEPGFSPHSIFGREETIKFLGYHFMKVA